jgi:hypothetical protein
MGKWDEYAVDTPTNKWDEYTVESPSNIVPPAGVSNITTPLNVAGAGISSALAAYGLGKMINTPNRLIKPITEQLNTISKKEFGKIVSSDDIPSLLKSKYTLEQSKVTNPSLQSMNQDLSMKAKTIRNQKALFDQHVLNPSVDDTAQHIAKNYKPVLDSAYGNYRKGLNQIESIIEQSGKTISSEDISQNLIQKTISDSLQEGVPEEKLSKLIKFGNSLDKISESQIIDVLGEPLSTDRPISFRQLKGNFNALIKDLPPAAQYKFSENWSNFLRNHTPAEAVGILDEINSKYAPFAQMRNALYKLVDTKSGEFNVKALSSRLKGLVKSGNDAGLTDVLKILSNGSDFTNPIEGLSTKLKSLEDLSTQRTSFNQHLIDLDTVKIDAQQKAQQARDLISSIKRNYADISNKTMMLLAEKQSIMEKYPNRTKILQILGKAPSVALKALISKRGLLGAAGAVGIVSALSNPVEAAESFIGGSTTLGSGEIPANPLTDYEWDAKGKLRRK